MKLPRSTIELLITEAEIEMIDAIIHNEQTRLSKLKETHEWLSNLLPKKPDPSGSALS